MGDSKRSSRRAGVATGGGTAVVAGSLPGGGTIVQRRQAVRADLEARLPTASLQDTVRILEAAALLGDRTLLAKATQRVEDGMAILRERHGEGVAFPVGRDTIRGDVPDWARRHVRAVESDTRYASAESVYWAQPVGNFFPADGQVFAFPPPPAAAVAAGLRGMTVVARGNNRFDLRAELSGGHTEQRGDLTFAGVREEARWVVRDLMRTHGARLALAGARR